MPETPSDLCTSGFYACNSLAVRTVTFSASPKRTASVGLHSIVGTNSNDFVRVLTNNDVCGKKVVACSFDEQMYRRAEVRLTNFQIDEVQKYFSFSYRYMRMTY